MNPLPRKPYPTDLSDKEWTILEPLVPAVKTGGRPACWERREIANAIFYVTRSGCTWRQLPHDFPPWQTVYYYFRIWRRDGTLEALHTRLRKRLRRALGRRGQGRRRGIGGQTCQEQRLKARAQRLALGRRQGGAAGV